MCYRYKIIAIIENFYKFFYDSTTNDFLSHRPKILNIESEKVFEIERRMIIAAIGQIKNNKNLGKDEITCKMLKIGGKAL